MLKYFKTKRQQTIKSPLTGEVVDLEDVPDEVFARKLVGDGVAINPTTRWLVAPVEGTVVNISSAKHAIGIITRDELEILIHLGIETVELEGRGFNVLVGVGQEVGPGDRLMEIDWQYIRDKVPAILSPVIITSMGIVDSIKVLKVGPIRSGEDLMSVTLKQG